MKVQRRRHYYMNATKVKRSELKFFFVEISSIMIGEIYKKAIIIKLCYIFY